MANFAPVKRIDLSKLIYTGANSENYVKNAPLSLYKKTAAVNTILDNHPEKTEAFQKEALDFGCAEVNPNIMIAKKKICSVIQKVTQSIQPFSSIIIYGSTVNGCADNTSDLDLCWHIPRNIAQKMSKDCVTQKLLLAERRIRRLFPVRNSIFIDARVQIIKFNFNVDNLVIEVDVSLNNLSGVYNTVLLKFYATVDWRFSALARIMKHWGKEIGIIAPLNRLLNSYTMRLMVLHFFQCGVYPPIFPNLSAKFPKLLDGRLHMEKVKAILDGRTQFPEVVMKDKNEQSLTSLVFGFLVYWKHYYYPSFGVSVRLGSSITKRCTNAFFIEECYNRTTVAQLINRDSVNLLVHMFSAALIPLYNFDYSFNTFLSGIPDNKIVVNNYPYDRRFFSWVRVNKHWHLSYTN